MKSPFRRAPCAAFVLLPLAACCGGVFAQAAAPEAAASAPAAEVTLPSIRVKAASDTERATGPVDGYRARRSSTATRTDTPLNELPQSVSVVTADQIRDQDAKTMQEVLRYSAGVRSDMYGLDNRGDWFNLRGGSEGSTLLDGLRLPLTGWYGVVRNEPFAFERVEVLRGPASVMAGQNGPGGVVNLVSKRPQAEAMREVQLQVGNERHRQAALDLTGPLAEDGSLLYRLVALHKDSGTQVQHADERRSYVAPSLTWKPQGGSTLTVYAEYQKDFSGNVNGFFPIVGTLRPGPNGTIPVDTFIGEPAWDRYGGERRRVGYELEQQLDARWTLRHHLRHDRVDGGMRSMYAAWYDGFRDANGNADPNGRYLNRQYYLTDDSGRITNADLLLEGRFATGGLQHTLLAGVDAMRSRNGQRSSNDAPAPPLDVYDPVYGSFPEPDFHGQPTNFTETRVRNLGVLLQDQVKLGPHWIVVAGLRHDSARTSANGWSSTGADTSTPERSDSANSKNLGVVYRADAWSPYLGYSESFEPVSGTDFFGAGFKPKRGKQLEAGVKWSPAEFGLTASAAAYRLKETDRLTTDPDPAHTGFSVQRGEVTVDGVELELNAALRAWDLIASYTHMDARQTEAAGGDAATYLGRQLSGIPKDMASAWAVFKFGSLGLPALQGLRAGAGVRYVGKTSDGADVTDTPSYTLVDLMLSHDAGPWRLALNVSNLTDKTYVATCLERGDCWYGSRRKAVATVAYRW